MPTVDFARYYLYDDLVAILQSFADEYPQFAALDSIGQSHEGRDIWLMTLTNKETGAADEKPAFWLDANIHATEVTGSTAALHLIAHLLQNYATDDAIRRLIDQRAFYIVPRFNPDGAEHALTQPTYIRSTKRRYPFEDERDGLYPTDINGDGKIVQMRIADQAGEWRVSEHDPRLMVRRAPDEDGGTYYRLYSEGMIRNWDGINIKIAPPPHGLDINRNFPFEWQPEAQQRGAGPYPGSEAEVRAVTEFIVKHPNIFAAITDHTYSGVILRPYSTRPDDDLDTHDLAVFKKIGERGTELMGYPNISVFHGFRYDPKEVTTGAFDDWLYDHFGVFCYTVELWDIVGEAGVKERDFIGWFRDHPEEDDLKILKWLDEHNDGNGFHTWHAYDHPQLGAVELGGWETMYTWSNPPHQFLEAECRKNTAFALAVAATGPRLDIRELSATHLADDLYRVRLVLVNNGFLPTSGSRQSDKRKAVQPIDVELTVPDGAVLELGEKKQQIGQLEGRSNRVFSWGDDHPTDYLKHVDWLVRGPEGTQVRVVAVAQRAGTVRRTVELMR